MTIIPNLGNIEISPLYSFLVELYAAIFIVILSTNLLVVIITFVINKGRSSHKKRSD
jgi:hypothetical protein